MFRDSSAAAREQPGPGEDDPLPPEDREAGRAHMVSLEILYRAHSPRLLRSLVRRTRSREDALDLVQEVFSRVARLGAARRARIARPEAYLSRMAGNLLRDHAIRDIRRSAHLHLVADEEVLAGPDPQQLLESRDMLRRLEAVMLRLKPRTREIFMAHRLDGMSYAEIADRFGLTVKGVEKQMSKAIAYIDRMLDRS